MKKFILIIFCLLILFVYYMYVELFPNELLLISGEKYSFTKLPFLKYEEILLTNSDDKISKDSEMDIKLLNIYSLKKIKISKINPIKVIPIGKVIGLRLYTNGVLVVGRSEIEDKNNNLVNPCNDIKEGDTILEINDTEVDNIASMKKIIKESKGSKLKVNLNRDGNVITSNITPVESLDREYKVGLWVKDAATGVGTMSFYEPTTGLFAVLGHGIVDSDTNTLIDIDSGELLNSKVLYIEKGKIGTPGEIKGTILNQKKIGNVKLNTKYGVYGKLENLTSLNIDTSSAIEVALRDEIKIGPAKIICSISDNISREYDIEIQNIYFDNDSSNKSMLIKITDEELLEKTGGIVRGLSGAPIIQNGKFIGAITNVFVSNPEMGYAIFADLMIKQLNLIE